MEFAPAGPRQSELPFIEVISAAERSFCDPAQLWEIFPPQPQNILSKIN